MFILFAENQDHTERVIGVFASVDLAKNVATLLFKQLQAAVENETWDRDGVLWPGDDLAVRDEHGNITVFEDLV